jgi:hypothetical protein
MQKSGEVPKNFASRSAVLGVMPRRPVNLLSTPHTYASRRNNANGSDQIVQIILIQDKLKQFNQWPDTIDIGSEKHHPLMRSRGMVPDVRETFIRSDQKTLL